MEERPLNYAEYPQLLSAVNRLLREKRTVVIAIHGRCGSGKTTLAGLLAQGFDCNVIHMDDFFLPPALRTAARLEEPGGNIHYERFLDEVVVGLRSGAPFAYRVFDCSRMDYADSPMAVAPKPLTIIEGSYSLHPHFASLYDWKVFTTCTVQEQLRRILARSGAAQLERFIHEWIPMEERYFEAFAIPQCCDRVLLSSQGATPSWTSPFSAWK